MPYDFIVVGSGPAGATIASRLANSIKAPSVLLLEAGDGNDGDATKILSERYSTFSDHPEINWGYKSVPQQVLGGRQVDYSRGKALGGSSAINFGVYTIGPMDDYDEWARLVGDDAFNWENTRRRYKKIENYHANLRPEYQKYAHPKPANHGTDGPLHVELAKIWEPEQLVFNVLDSARTYGFGNNLDINSGDPLGVGVAPNTSYKGYRRTAASAFLQDPPSNLKIIINSPVTKILIEDKRAVGVVADDEKYIATKDVIISCGAIDSPKLLLLSGIGPKEELAQHGIESINDLPGVGKNLHDHYYTRLLLQLRDGVHNRAAFFTDPKALAEAQEQFRQDGSGPLSVFHNSIPMGWIKNDALLETGEFQALPKQAQDHIRRKTVPSWEFTALSPVPARVADPTKTYLSISMIGMVTQSCGTVKLASSEPKDPPLCDPQLMTNAFDRRNAIEAIRKMMDFLNVPTLQKDIACPVLMPRSTSDEDIWAYLQENAAPSYHISCTVKMGIAEDPLACVMADFRVRGLESLRVVDMSVAPFLPNCHVQAVAYQIGEMAAEKMIAEYGLS